MDSIENKAYPEGSLIELDQTTGKFTVHAIAGGVYRLAISYEEEDGKEAFCPETSSLVVFADTKQDITYYGLDITRHADGSVNSCTVNTTGPTP